MKDIIWHPINGYEGLYEVSNYGHIKSLRKYRENVKSGHWLEERILNNSKTTTGYYKIELSKNKKKKSFKVHRLVAKAFIPNQDNKPYINHKDGNPLNNYVENLEWCTQKENVIHALETGLIPTLDIPKERISELYWGEKKTASEIADIFNTSVTPIYSRLRRFGIGVRSMSESRIKYGLTEEFILEGLKNKSTRQLAREVGCSPSLISAYAKRIRERGFIYAKQSSVNRKIG